MKKDKIDKIIDDWRRERPDLDPAPMKVVGRTLIIARFLEKRLEEYLKPFGLSAWSFDLLATLRRQGEPFTLTPSQLSEEMMLSSGAMTNRIDRLEAAGFVKRTHDPNDRRGYLISLSESGRELIDRAIEARFQEAKEAINSLSAKDISGLNSMLKALLEELSK